VIVVCFVAMGVENALRSKLYRSMGPDYIKKIRSWNVVGSLGYCFVSLDVKLIHRGFDVGFLECIEKYSCAYDVADVAKCR